MFSLGFHPALRKDLRRIAPDARETLITTVFPSLAEEPTRGIPLTGPLRGFWKYRVFLSGASYRIGYLVDTARREVIILAAGPRGGFYERLRRRMKT